MVRVFHKLFLVGSFIVVFNVALASDLVTDSWNTKMSMNQARWGLGVVEVAGKIYAIGGYAAIDSIVGTNECYDPVSDAWVFLTSMPTPRACFAIAAYNGKIYCIGGEIRDATGLRVDSRNEVYDTVTDSWSIKESFPVSGSYLHAGTANGKIFVVVEHDISKLDYSQDLYMYDPVTDIWTKKATIPALSSPGVYNTLTVVNDEIIVTGDYSFEDALNARYDYKVMIYNTQTDVWRAGASGSKVAHFGAAGATTGVYAPQNVYVIGLTSVNNAPLLTNRVYDPVSSVWSYAKDMPTLRKGFDIAVVDDIIYVIGGYTSNDFSLFTGGTIVPIALNEQYVPIGYGGGGSSELYELKSVSSYLVAALVAIIIGGSVGILSLYSKREEKMQRQITDS
jgi:N-acetylneuraminic acid mutarotase